MLHYILCKHKHEKNVIQVAYSSPLSIEKH
jgi:hypothetical protein